MTKEKINKTEIYYDVARAYADLRLPWEQAENIRNLNFVCSALLTPKEWFECMSQAKVNDYNDFDLKKTFNLLRSLDVQIMPGREGSVVFYLVGATIELKKAEKRFAGYADEIDYQMRDGDKWINSHGVVLRVWFD